METRKTFAIVGTGGRSPMFLDPIAKKYSGECKLVGLCDSSEVRRTFHQRRLSSAYGIEPVPTFGDFDEMLRTTHPDVVIVCTPDCFHHEFIVKALDFGCDVISEKPLTIDGPRYNLIAEAVERTGRQVRTTFNLRWSQGVTRVREIIASGVIGEVKHVDFEYALNTSHGADYFRRWHSSKEISGGLLLHKSTHHFDVINWWLDAIPSTVFAMGGLVFYGRKNAVARGDEALTKYPRYTGEESARKDPFCLTLDEDSTLRGLYLAAEAESGYIRDQNVFRDGIDIEDSMSVLIRYRSGEMVNYSLNAYSPSEGFRASISGDRGRIEYVEEHAPHIIKGDEDSRSDTWKQQMKLRVHRHFGAAEEITIVPGTGSHGGGDALIQEQMFAANPPADDLMRNAGHEQGAASLLIGAAANISIKNGQLIRISELAHLNPNARKLHELI